MAAELLNWKMFNKTFAKKRPANLSEASWKVLTSLLKGVIDPTEVNSKVLTAFKADKKASSTGIYELKLGLTYYKKVRAKITGEEGDVDDYATGVQQWKKLVVLEPLLQKSFEIYFPPYKQIDPKKKIFTSKWDGKKSKAGYADECIRISNTGKVWQPPVAAGARTTISTEEQEAISLIIIREVLNSKNLRWTSFKHMYYDKSATNSDGEKIGKKLRNIHPNLEGTDDWWSHFATQYKQIHGLAEFPSAKYTTFTHTKDFMEFISKLVTTGKTPDEGGAFEEFAKFSEKDSWNPADVWLIRTMKSPRFDNDNIRNLGLKQQLLQARTIEDINGIMKIAYKEKIIVGISLKKNIGYTKTQGEPQPGALKFETVNMEKKVAGKKPWKDQKLPSLKWIGVKFDPSFDEKKNAFTSKTSYLKFEYGGRTFFLDFKSNQGNKQTDITYEFNEEGSKAQIGKIPKDRFTKGMQLRIDRDYPHHEDYDSFDESTPSFIIKHKVIRESGILNITKTPGWIEKHGNWWNMGKATETTHWSKPVKDAKLFPKETAPVPIFVINMKKAWKASSGKNYNFKSYRNIVMYQMFDFLYCVALLHKGGPKKMKRYLSDLFYHAQKKGQKWDFGPFGKLY